MESHGTAYIPEVYGLYLCYRLVAHGMGELIVSSYRSRPTAVNLADSANKLKAVADKAAEAPGATPQTVAKAVVSAAEAWMEDDIAANKVGNPLGGLAPPEKTFQQEA